MSFLLLKYIRSHFEVKEYDMNQLMIILALVFLLCFTLYQWWFQSTRFKQMSDKDQKKINLLNKPLAWMLYSISLFFIVIILIAYHIMQLMEAIMNLDI